MDVFLGLSQNQKTKSFLGAAYIYIWCWLIRETAKIILLQ